MVATRGDGNGAVIVEEQRQRKEIKPAWREAWIRGPRRSTRSTARATSVAISRIYATRLNSCEFFYTYFL